MPLTKPPALKPFDTVAVVAPSGPFDRESFDAGLAVLRSRYDVRLGEGLFETARYLAGSDERRTAELVDALNNPEVKAVFAARGGYGAMRVLEHVSLPRLPHKALVGFSDLTALHAALQTAGRVSIHGPVVTQLGKQSAAVAQQLFALLENPSPPPVLHGQPGQVPGQVQGPLLGGNLSVFTRLLGTPFMPALTGGILLLEDVGERPYRLDRMWTHLKLAGVFKQIAGIVLGDFTLCEEKDASYTSADVLASLVQETGLPCAGGFSIGHGEVNVAVPLGTRVQLDATQGTLTFLEGAVSA
ncbi:MAG: LD-carboxypeptidase [Myxococcaceae bacterium]|nr:LD-carboxypeptidase [Myxococcaceae bacterium]